MTINFRDEEHQEFYSEKMKEVRYKDSYHAALIYTLGICALSSNYISRTVGMRYKMMYKEKK